MPIRWLTYELNEVGETYTNFSPLKLGTTNNLNRVFLLLTISTQQLIAQPLRESGN